MYLQAQTNPAAEIDENWTDKGIIKFLGKFKSGCDLPSNVTNDVNPHQFMPSNLPAGMWYYYSGVKKDAEHGYWLETGEACEIFSDSAITGWRTTLRFHEGRAPDGQKTNWMMQEYRTTEKCNNNLKDPRALCRVFLVEGHWITDGGVINTLDIGTETVSNVKSRSGQIANSELLETNIENGSGPSRVAKNSPEPDPPVENFSDTECIKRGDFLELNDLLDPAFSSSANSSCLSMTSEERFDSMALWRELGEDSMDWENRDSNVKLNIFASTKLKEVVVCPATLGSLTSGEEPSTDKASNVDPPTGNKQEDHRNGSPKTTASSSGSERSSKEEKKDRVGRNKKHKMIKYLCFLAF